MKFSLYYILDNIEDKKYMSNFVGAVNGIYDLHDADLDLTALLKRYASSVATSSDNHVPPDPSTRDFMLFEDEEKPNYSDGMALGYVFNHIFGKHVVMVFCDEDEDYVIIELNKMKPLFTFYCEFTTMLDQYGYERHQRRKGFEDVINLIEDEER